MKKFGIIILFISLFLTLWVTPVWAKSYSIESDVFNLVINPDKSVNVVENLTYDFDGSFSWAEMWVPTKITRGGYVYDSTINDFTVSVLDNSEVTVLEKSQKNNKFYVKWGYQAYNTSRTFVISYQINNAVHKYPDIAEFYWQIIGSDWQVAHRNVEVKVRLPQPVVDTSQISVYGHGPLNGRSEIVDNQTVRFISDQVSAGQFMEIRVIFPGHMITGNFDGTKTLSQIKSEEEKFVRETIESAKRVQSLDKLIKMWIVVAPFVSLSSFIIWFLWWLEKWKKYGREHKAINVPKYFRELPDELTPAEVDVLLKQGQEPSVNSFTATIFDLARRGFIEIRDQMVQKTGLFGTKQEFKSALFLKTEKFNKDRTLKDYEKDLLNFIFFTVGGTKAGLSEKILKRETADEDKNDTKVTLEEIKTWLKKHPREFQEKFSQWKKSVKEGSDRLQFLE